MPHVNKKPPERKQIFVQTPFSYSTLETMAKNFTPQKHLFFPPLPVSAMGVGFGGLEERGSKSPGGGGWTEVGGVLGGGGGGG